MNRSVAYLTSTYGRAGDTFIRREVEELRRLGWTVHTFSIRRPGGEERVSADVARAQETTDYVLEHGAIRLLAASARAFLRSPRRFLRALRQAGSLRWPGLRSWVWHLAYLLEASWLAGQLSRRGVALLHDHIAMSSATVAALASTLSGVPFTMTVHGLELLAAEHWALGRKVEASAATICVSDHGRSQCMMFAPPGHWGRLHVVRCGLDAAFLDAPPVPLPETNQLVCVGRLSPEKGQLLLVDAVAELRAGGVPAEILLVGDGPSRQAIERRAAELGVGGSIRIAGWQGSEEVRASISRCRALVLPSFSEGIPVVLMEAMALRRPVIATHVGGIPELVRHGECGWLVPPGSSLALAGAMREALRSPPERLDRMGEAGRGRVLALHDLARETRKLAEVFEEAIEGGAAARD